MTSTHGSDRPAARDRPARRLPLVLLAIPVTLLGAIVLGMHVPTIPVLGPGGSALGMRAAWVAVAALLLLVLGIVLLARRRTWGRGVVASIAALSLLGAGAAALRLVAFGSDHGITVSPFGAALPASAPDREDRYAPAGTEATVAIWEPTDVDDAPVAVFVHGGGWISGSPTDNSAEKRWLADQGWLVLSLGYPLSDADHHLWDSTVDRLACGLAWTQQNLDALGGDPDRVVLLGDSAGGNLVLQLAFQTAAGTLDPCGGTLPTIAAVATVYPVADPATFYENGDLLLGRTARTMAGAYTGGSPQDFPERYASITPATDLTADAPPTLVISAGSDHLVPGAPARALAHRVDEVAGDGTAVTVPYAEHVFDASPVGQQLYLGLLEEWLTARGLWP